MGNFLRAMTNPGKEVGDWYEGTFLPEGMKKWMQKSGFINDFASRGWMGPVAQQFTDEGKEAETKNTGTSKHTTQMYGAATAIAAIIAAAYGGGALLGGGAAGSGAGAGAGASGAGAGSGALAYGGGTAAGGSSAMWAPTLASGAGQGMASSWVPAAVGAGGAGASGSSVMGSGTPQYGGYNNPYAQYNANPNNAYDMAWNSKSNMGGVGGQAPTQAQNPNRYRPQQSQQQQQQEIIFNKKPFEPIRAEKDAIMQEAIMMYLRDQYGKSYNIGGSTTQNSMPNSNYGLRSDGTAKGTGYFGELQRPDGKVSTELSVGVNFDGREMEIPSLVPTLSQSEVNYLLSGGKPTQAIINKAVEHAKQRMSQGKSPYAN